MSRSSSSNVSMSPESSKSVSKSSTPSRDSMSEVSRSGSSAKVPPIMATPTSSTKPSINTNVSSPRSALSPKQSSRSSEDEVAASQPLPEDLCITVGCRNLITFDDLKNICFIIGLFIRDPKTKLLKFLAHTEVIRDNLSPDFTRPLVINGAQALLEQGAEVVLNVYQPSKSATLIKNNDIVGYTSCLLSSLNEHVNGFSQDFQLMNLEKPSINKILKHNASTIYVRSFRPGMEPVREMAPHSSLATEQAVQMMMEGRTFTKYTPNHRPVVRDFFYRMDSKMGTLYYATVGDRTVNPIRAIPLYTILGIIAHEKDSQVPIWLRKPMQQSSSTQSTFFSIILERKTIDLQATSAMERNAYMFGIHSILVQHGFKLRKLATPGPDKAKIVPGGKSESQLKAKGVDIVQLLSNSLAFISHGAELIKFDYNHESSSLKYFFYASPQEYETDPKVHTPGRIRLGKLHWCKPGNNNKRTMDNKSCLPLSIITDIYVGKKTRVFRRKIAESIPDNVCFSIGDRNRTLDIQCKNHEDRNQWISAFECILVLAGVRFNLHVLDHILQPSYKRNKKRDAMKSPTQTKSSPPDAVSPRNLVTTTHFSEPSGSAMTPSTSMASTSTSTSTSKSTPSTSSSTTTATPTQGPDEKKSSDAEKRQRELQKILQVSLERCAELLEATNQNVNAAVDVYFAHLEDGKKDSSTRGSPKKTGIQGTITSSLKPPLRKGLFTSNFSVVDEEDSGSITPSESKEQTDGTEIQSPDSGMGFVRMERGATVRARPTGPTPRHGPDTGRGSLNELNIPLDTATAIRQTFNAEQLSQLLVTPSETPRNDLSIYTTLRGVNIATLTQRQLSEDKTDSPEDTARSQRTHRSETAEERKARKDKKRAKRDRREKEKEEKGEGTGAKSSRKIKDKKEEEEKVPEKPQTEEEKKAYAEIAAIREQQEKEAEEVRAKRAAESKAKREEDEKKRRAEYEQRKKEREEKRAKKAQGDNNNGGIPDAPDFPDAPPMAPGMGPPAATVDDPNRVKLKPFHFERLAGVDVEDTVFDDPDLEDAAFAIEGDADMIMNALQDQFRAQAPKKQVKIKGVGRSGGGGGDGGDGDGDGGDGDAAAASHIPLVSGKKANNIEITFKKLKLTPLQIRNAIIQVDTSILRHDITSLLLAIWPSSSDEVKLARSYKGDITQLSVAECFYYYMTQYTELYERLKAIAFRTGFEDHTDELRNTMSIVETAAREIKYSGNLKIVLACVRSIGNFMNEGKKTTQAFRLSALERLDLTKSMDGKTTLLDFIVHYIATNFESDGTKLKEPRKKPPKAEMQVSFLNDLHSVQPAASISWDDIMGEVKSLSTQLNLISSCCASPLITCDGVEDRFRTLMLPWLGDAMKTCDELKDMCEAIKDQVNDLITFFGENPTDMSLSSFLSIFTNLLLLYERAEERLIQRDMAESRALAMEQAKQVQAKQKQGIQQYMQGRRQHVSGGDSSSDFSSSSSDSDFSDSDA